MSQSFDLVLLALARVRRSIRELARACLTKDSDSKKYHPPCTSPVVFSSPNAPHESGQHKELISYELRLIYSRYADKHTHLSIWSILSGLGTTFLERTPWNATLDVTVANGGAATHSRISPATEILEAPLDGMGASKWDTRTTIM